MSYVLIIDDDEDFAGSIAQVLEAEGHEVAIEQDSRQGLTRIENRRPDIVVLDVMFPENPGAGFELARNIRRVQSDLPIVMVTAVNPDFPLGFSGKDVCPSRLPVTDYLEKPVNLEVLCERVNRLAAQ